MAVVLDHVNAALVICGMETITAFSADSSVGNRIATLNYELLVVEKLTEYPWKFARKEAACNHLSDTPYNPWTHAWQLPSGLLLLRDVRVGGLSIAYALYGDDKIFNNYDSSATVMALHSYRAAEAKWPGYFGKGIRLELECLFLRGTERHAEAVEVDKVARAQWATAKRLDAQSQSPRDPGKHPTLEARRGAAT